MGFIPPGDRVFFFSLSFPSNHQKCSVVDQVPQGIASRYVFADLKKLCLAVLPWAEVAQQDGLVVTGWKPDVLSEALLISLHSVKLVSRQTAQL